MKEFALDIERKWGTQKTTMTVYSHQESPNVLAVSTPLGEFLKSVKEEIGSVTFITTQKAFEKKFDEAVTSVLKEIGKATKPYAGNIPEE